MEESEQFLLGFIAGEGSFNFNLQKRDAMKCGLLASPRFAINVTSGDRRTLERLQSRIGGSIDSRETTHNPQVCLVVIGLENCKRVAEFVDRYAGPEFRETQKWESFTKWKSLIEDYSPPKSRDEVKEIVYRAKDINPHGSSGRSAEEWMSVIDGQI